MQSNIVPPYAVSVHEAAKALGLGVTTTKNLIASGALASIRVGRRVLISKYALDEFVQNSERLGAAANPAVGRSPDRAS